MFRISAFVFTVLATPIILRVFFVENYYVSTGSMERSIRPGSFIAVNKISYGARLPHSFGEVPWLDLILYIFNIGAHKPRYQDNSRMPDIRPVKYNDIIIFNQPFNEEEVFIKRCVGLPGDTVQLIDALIYLNGKIIQDGPNTLYDYDVSFREGVDPIALLKKIGIKYKESWSDRRSAYKKIALTTPEVSRLRLSHTINDIIRMPTEKKPVPGKQKKTRYILPQKGSMIKLSENDTLLSKLIIDFEDPAAHLNNGRLYKKGKLVEYYRFKYNYYFMLGDNRDYSIDSRSWGLLPEYLIIGKASFLVPEKFWQLKNYKFL